MTIAAAATYLVNLSDPATRADLSDWAVNTLRDEFGHQKALAIVGEEFARIQREGITDLGGYLRVRRVGSVYRINRRQRVAIWCHWASRQAR